MFTRLFRGIWGWVRGLFTEPAADHSQPTGWISLRVDPPELMELRHNRAMLRTLPEPGSEAGASRARKMAASLPQRNPTNDPITSFPAESRNAHAHRGTAFDSKASPLFHPVRWAQKLSERGRTLTQLFQRFHRKPDIIERSSPERVEPEFAEKNADHAVKIATWQQAVLRPQPPSSIFPKNERRQHFATSFPDRNSDPAFAPLQIPPADRGNSAHLARGAEYVEALFTPVSRGKANVSPWMGEQEMSSQEVVPPPEMPVTSWPDLPDSAAAVPITFSRDTVPQHVARSSFAPNVHNYWPELAADSGTTNFDCRSLNRALQRSQRLEREQRGY